MSKALPTPYTFVQAHGDPVSWCGAEFDEWLAICDRAVDIHERLERAAVYVQSHPGATSAEILAAFQGGAAR